MTECTVMGGFYFFAGKALFGAMVASCLIGTLALFVGVGEVINNRKRKK